MLLNTLEIKKQRFRRNLFGYDRREVRSFLDAVAEDFAQLRHERNQLEVQMRELEEELGRFRQIERGLRDAMMLASESVELARERADSLVVDARARASAIVSEGETNRRSIIAEAETQRRELVLDLQGLEQKRDLALGKLRALVEDERAVLESHQGADAEEDPARGDSKAKVLSMREAK